MDLNLRTRPGSTGCMWFETPYQHFGIPYKYRSESLTPIHAILRRKEGVAGRATETRRFDRSLPAAFGVASTVVGVSPGWEAVWAKRKAAANARDREEQKVAEAQRRTQFGLDMPSFQA